MRILSFSVTVLCCVMISFSGYKTSQCYMCNITKKIPLMQTNWSGGLVGWSLRYSNRSNPKTCEDNCVYTFTNILILYHSNNKTDSYFPEDFSTEGTYKAFCSCKTCHSDKKYKVLDIYHLGWNCNCTEGYYGQKCQLEVGNKYYAERSKHFIYFRHHLYTWKSGLYRTLCVIPSENVDNNQPFTVKLEFEFAVFFFTKYTDTVRREEALNWCLNRNFAEYCTLFYNIFDPKGFNVEFKYLFCASTPVPFIDLIDFKRSACEALDLIEYKGKIHSHIGFNNVTIHAGNFIEPLFKEYKGEYVRIYNYEAGSGINYTNVDDSCIPKFYMQSCNNYYLNTTDVHMDEEVEMQIEYKMPEKCKFEVKPENIKWHMSRVQYDHEYISSPDLVHVGTDFLNFKFQKWTFSDIGAGVVHVSLRMGHIAGGENFENIKMCYLRLIYVKLTIKFPEGPERHLNLEHNNILDVDARNPNFKLERQKEGLIYTWNCTYNDTNERCTEIEKYMTKDSSTANIPRNTFKLGWKYRIGVKVHHDKLGSEYDAQDTQLLTIGTESVLFSICCGTCDVENYVDPREFNFLYLKGLKCEGKPYEEVDSYVWQYKEYDPGASAVTDYTSAEGLRAEGTINELVFKIGKKKLNYDRFYTFKVVEKKGDKLLKFATLTIKTRKWNFVLECDVLPDSGVRGWTDFQLDCDVPIGTFYFEFYDKDNDDDHFFSGRMLGYGINPSLTPFKLTKGMIVVLAFDRFKTIFNFTCKVELTPFNDTLEYLKGLITQVEELMSTKSYDWPLRLTSSTVEVIENKMSPDNETIRKPVLTVQEVPLQNFLPMVKIVLSTLQVVLNNTVKKFNNFVIEAYLPLSSATTLLGLSKVFLEKEMNMEEERSLTKTIFLEMATAIINCVELILEQKNLEILSKIEEYANPFVFEMVEDTSFKLVEVLEIIGVSLDRQQEPGDSVDMIESDHGNILAVSKVDDAFLLSNWTLQEEDTRVVIPLILAKSVANENDTMGIMYIRISINPFWWTPADIVTDVLLVNYSYQKNHTIRILKKFKYRMELYLNVTEPLTSLTITEGVTSQLNTNKMSPTDLDLAVTVYTFFLPPRAKLFIQFFFDKFTVNDTNIKNTTDTIDQEYRVWFQEGYRPDYETLVKHAKTINVDTPEYKLFYDNVRDQAKVYHMAILPGKSVPVGEDVRFRIRAHYSLCLTWFKWHWTSLGCWVGKKTNTVKVQCDCNHLSLVAGAMTTPDHKFDPTWEFILYLTPWPNLLPLLILFLILLLYLLLLCFAILWDKNDKKMGDIIVLNDNFPGENYAYLLGVYTGSRLFSGTTATVGVRLYGEIDISRPHLLQCADRKILKSFSDDWFLIYCPRDLGKLHGLLVWHNNGGSRPDWFLDKIEVYDLHCRVEYIFLVQEWISVDIEYSPEVSIRPLKVIEYFDVQNIFYINLINAIRDRHLIASLFFKHSRNPVTRVQRLNIILLFILVAMAVSLLLFYIYFRPENREDKFAYETINADYWILIPAFLLPSICTFILIALYRKSFTNNYKTITNPRDAQLGRLITLPDKLDESLPGENQLTYINESEIKHFRRVQTIHLEESVQRHQLQYKPGYMRSTWENVVMAIHKLAKCQALLPVKLPQYKVDKNAHKLWLYSAWAFFVLLSVLCVLVVLAVSWRLPTVKAEHFLTVFGVVILLDIALISVVTVIVSAAILSIMFQNILPLTSYHVRIKDGCRMPLYGNRRFLGDLIEARKSKLYYPLPEAEKYALRRKMIRKYRWHRLIDLIILLVVLAILTFAVLMFHKMTYYSNSHVTAMITVTYKGEGLFLKYPKNYDELFNRTEYYDFLEFTFLPKVYKFMWYNYMPLNDPDNERKDFAADSVMRLLGNLRLRQLRVHVANCSNKIISVKEPCAPAWRRDTEDKDVYSTGWITADYKHPATMSLTWKYTPPNRSNSTRFYGKSGTLYHGGGYVADLGNYRRQTKGFLALLEKEDWLDHMTRAVMVEFTLYNVNTNLFTQVVLVTEQTPFGEYINLPKVVTVKSEMGFNFWTLAILVFLIFFLLQMLYFINRKGFFDYFSYLSNIFELFTLVLGFGAFIIYIMHIKSSAKYIEEFHNSGLDQFFSFFKIYRYAYFSNMFITFWFLCIVIKLLSALRFGGTFFRVYFTLKYFWRETAITLIYLIILLSIIWRFIGYRLNVFLYSHYSIFLLYYKHYNIITVNESPSPNMLVYITCALSGIVMFILISTYVHFYKIAKGVLIRIKDYDKFTFIEFLKNEFLRLKTKS